MNEYVLTETLTRLWEFLGFKIKYQKNETSDIVMEGSRGCIYFDRYNTSSFFSLTTNVTMSEDIVKAAYATLIILNKKVAEANKGTETEDNGLGWGLNELVGESATDDSDFI